MPCHIGFLQVSFLHKTTTATPHIDNRFSVLQLQIMESARKQFRSFKCENGVLQGKLLSVSVILFLPSGVKIIEEKRGSPSA